MPKQPARLYFGPVKRFAVIRSLAFRLTVWYSLVLTSVAVLCFALAYFMFESMSIRRADRFLGEEAKHLQELTATNNLTAALESLPRRARLTGTNDLFLRILRADGTEVGSSDLSEWKEDNVGARVRAAPLGGAAVLETWNNLPKHRRARVIYAPLGPDLVAQIGLSMQPDEALLSELGEMAVVFTLGAVLLAVLVGWLMARRALSRVHEVSDTAIVISQGALDRRVAVTGWEDEVDVLAQSFNRMVERIQALIGGIKQTNDNIAHELRSPITRMRALADVNLARAPTGSEYHALAVSTLEESDRLLALINTMLDIAEVEAGVARLTLSPVDVGAIVRDACDIFEPVAEQSGVTLEEEAGAECMVLGDLPKLQRAVANLVDNAIKYSPRGGKVRAEVAVVGGEVELAISDQGPGISEEDLPHIFQRFYRGEKSRTHKGYGLGLSLAKAIVGAHRGTIEVANLHPGCRFVIRLPAMQGGERRGGAQR